MNDQLHIHACVFEHDAAKRKELMEQLNRLNVQPEIHEGTIEFYYDGGLNTVTKLAGYVESHKFHSVQISGD